MAHLLKGSHSSIISQNVRDLCKEGMSQSQAMSLAMKLSRKGMAKKMDRMTKKIVKANTKKVR